MQNIAPIALFAYNRPDHIRKVLEELQKNQLAKQSELFVFSDGPKNASNMEKVTEVRQYLKAVNGFAQVNIVEQVQNLGLANSIISGVSDILDRFDKVIVIEDDLITSPSFLTFMNKALNIYQDNPKISSVSGYSLPLSIPPDYLERVYLTYRHSSWGWGTWRRVWRGIDWDVKDYNHFRNDRRARREFNVAGPDMSSMLDMQMAGAMDSWSIRFDYSCFKLGLLSVAPVGNLVINIGFDGTGVHCGTENEYLQSKLTEWENTFTLPSNLKVDPRIVDATRKLFSYSFRAKLKQYIKLLFRIKNIKACHDDRGSQ